MHKWFLAVALMSSVSPALAQQKFKDLVGPIGVENVQDTKTLEVRYLTWGGDVAGFLANGGLTTVKDSTYQKLGLNVKFSKGDDFVQQVRDYMQGKTPFLRGTLDMFGQASEVLGSDPRTKPVVFLQLTWSAGDHVVCRENIKSLNDLVRKDGKKVKIAVQQGGPHVGLVYAILQAAQATREQVEIVWVQDLTGPKGPAELFRNDSTIDAACVITPDAIGLCGGLDQKGSGQEGTVKAAKVVVSTLQMSRAIPDVYAVRADYFNTHKDVVEKFAAGYLKGCDDLVALRKKFTESNKLSPEYHNILTIAQKAFGEDVIPTLEVDGHGLLLDAIFVGPAGQVAFFEDKGNLNNYDAKAKQALDLAVGWGYAGTRSGFSASGLNYEKVAGLAGLKYEAPKSAPRIDAESVDLFPDSNLDDRTILSFTINFEPNQNQFTVDQYGAEFNRAIKAASDFGNAVVVIRGHADPTKTLADLIKAGMAKNVIKRAGNTGNYKYYFDGKELNLANTPNIVKVIKEGGLEGTNPSPRETMQAALNLSQSRAMAVKEAVVNYAKLQGLNLDMTQIQPQGAGISEPLVAKPNNIEDAKKNMRVEFKIVKVPAEALKSSDFDF